jgi:hypothetical protein
VILAGLFALGFFSCRVEPQSPAGARITASTSAREMPLLDQRLGAGTVGMFN